MLTAARSKLREWVLFLLVALLPALGMGMLGLRALRNEEAAVRQAMRSELDLVASATQQSYQDRLSALREADPASLERLLDEAAPFVDRLEVGGDGVVRDPPAAAAVDDHDGADEARQRACRETLARLQEPEAAELRQQLLRDCQDVRSDSGRHLWPIVALDPRTEPKPSPSELRGWLERHAEAMSATERAATRVEIEQAAWLPADTKSAATRLLRSGPRSHAAASFVGQRRARILAGASEIAWSDAGSRGRLVKGPRGDYLGYVVHPGSLARAVRGGWPELASNARADLVLADAAPQGPSVELLTEGAYLSLRWADPGEVDKRSRRSQQLLAGIALSLGVLAVLLAAFMFTRMRAASRLSALRTDFVAAVSHELRTPIASMRMLAELLAEDRIDDPAERREAEQALAREAARLSTTVHRLLGFSRMEAGKQSARRSRARLAPLLEAGIQDFEQRHPDMPAVTRQLDERLEADVDADALAMALDNLLRNAHKYAPEGTPYEVSLTGDDRHATLRVRDHGPGIARADQRRIFLPFERADDRLSAATEGSGIGLSLVQHVARSHGGRAWVDSAPGKGATFVIEIARQA